MPKPNLLTRRQTLSGMALLGLGGTARAMAGKTIAILGAGLAGLNAARALRAAGATVMVFESRRRIGGRIRTSRLWPELPMDLGASWIHGVAGNPLTALADEAGAQRLKTDYAHSVSFGPDGAEIDLDADMEMAEAMVERARDAAESRDNDQSLSDAIQSQKAWKVASPATRRVVRHFVNSTVEQEYGGSWNEISAWQFDGSKEFEGGDELFPDGFDQIVNYLARGQDIRLGLGVTALAPRVQGVVLTLSNGSTFVADHVVITAPLGVLREGQIDFAEALAPSRQLAIDTLRMGLLNKCWLRFERVAWPADVDWMEWLGPVDGAWAQWVSLKRAADLPILLGFNAADQARTIETLNDADTIASAHDALKGIFGTSFPAPLAGQVTRWSQDPHAQGSYSFNPVGTSAKTRNKLAGLDWDGRLVFAGEATSADYFGTAHGAVLSGLKAASSLGA